MWKIVRLFRPRDLSLLNFEEKHPQHSGQRLLRYELRRIAKYGAHTAEGLLAPLLPAVAHSRTHLAHARDLPTASLSQSYFR